MDKKFLQIAAVTVGLMASLSPQESKALKSCVCMGQTMEEAAPCVLENGFLNPQSCSIDLDCHLPCSKLGGSYTIGYCYNAESIPTGTKACA